MLSCGKELPASADPGERHRVGYVGAGSAGDAGSVPRSHRAPSWLGLPFEGWLGAVPAVG